MLHGYSVATSSVTECNGPPRRVSICATWSTRVKSPFSERDTPASPLLTATPELRRWDFDLEFVQFSPGRTDGPNRYGSGRHGHEKEVVRRHATHRPRLDTKTRIRGLPPAAGDDVVDPADAQMFVVVIVSSQNQRHVVSLEQRYPVALRRRVVRVKAARERWLMEHDDLHRRARRAQCARKPRTLRRVAGLVRIEHEELRRADAPRVVVARRTEHRRRRWSGEVVIPPHASPHASGIRRETSLGSVVVALRRDPIRVVEV